MTELKVSHGSANRTLAIGKWRLTEASYAPGQRVPAHEHALSSWTFVISGRIEETFSNRSFVYGRGSVLTKPAIAAHANLYGELTRCLLIETRDADTKFFDVPRLFAHGSIPRLAQRIHRESSERDKATLFSLECLLLELRLACERRAYGDSGKASKQWLNDVHDNLECEFRDPPSLGELARIHGLHPAYICQQFKTQFGMRIGDFVRDVRFAWAREAVASGFGSLSDIAFAAGFSDQSHLSRDFKRRLGISPRRFRSQTKAI